MILCITNNIDLDTTAFSESVVNTYIRFQYYLSLDHNQLFRHINIPGRPNTRSKKSKKPKSIQKILNIVSNKIRKRNNKIISAFPYHALTQDGIIQNPIPINPDIQNDSCYSDFSNSKNLQYLKHYTLLPKQAQLELTKSLKEITYQLLFDSNFDTFLENISDFALRQKMITHMIEWIEEYLDFTNDDEIKSFFKKLPEGLVKMALRFIYADKNNGTNIDTYRMNEIRNNLRQNKTEVDLGFCFNPTFGNLPDTFIMPIIEIAQPLYHVKNKSINLRSNHLTHIHSGLKNITHLKGLSLEANQIKKIHENFSKLIHLKQCNLINNSLKIFPPAICHLKSLEELKIRVKNLEIMPDNIKQMQSLKKLSLRCCGGRSLASEIGYLPALEELNISFSLDITQLPATIGNLSSLRVLNLECLSKVQSLPDEICKLSQLQKLGLKNCFRLTKLPDNIEALTNLQHLDIRDTKIPVDSIPEALRKQLGNNLLKD
jgi:Leucine-rich repeat (LRR) protein